jgi:hypothetical protein
MENSTSYKRVTLKLPEESYAILISESKERKRETVIRDALLLYSQGKRIDGDLLEILQVIRHTKIAIEYMDFNMFVEDEATNEFYKTNYKKSLKLLGDVENHLNSLRTSFSRI